MMGFNHVSVLLDEAVGSLNIKPDGVYVDGTLGGAGHSLEIVKRLSGRGRLVGIDRDAYAIGKARDVLKGFVDRVSFVNGNFSEFDIILDKLGIDSVDGVLLDLGVSSFQLDEAARGFSYNHDAALDMRMGADARLTAFDVVNTYSEKDLAGIISKYGEERWAARIAEFIVLEREAAPINTTFELVTVIKKAIPKNARRDGPHPAKRTFQAIRIEVNNELGILENAVKDIVRRLSKGGRVSVITFHSLEDRIIKNVFRELENPCTCPRSFPICVCGGKAVLKTVGRKPVLPGEDELEHNHRARSAKLRTAEKI